MVLRRDMHKLVGNAIRAARMKIRAKELRDEKEKDLMWGDLIIKGAAPQEAMLRKALKCKCTHCQDLVPIASTQSNYFEAGWDKGYNIAMNHYYNKVPSLVDGGFTFAHRMCASVHGFAAGYETSLASCVAESQRRSLL